MNRSEVVRRVNDLYGDAGHQKVLTIYNSQQTLPRNYKLKATDAWCAATVSAVFLMAGDKSFVECSCSHMIDKAKNLGIWIEDDNYIPSPGDVIMYDWQDNGDGDNKGMPDHVGIVISVTGKKFVVREGNKNNSIGNRDMKVGGKYIRGYIVPKYEVEENEYSKEAKMMPTIKSGSKGKAVAMWQIIVDAKPDGTFGSETVTATKIFQKNHGLTQDGIVGTKTWNEGLKTI